MRAIVLMFDSLNRHMLPPYGDTFVDAPNFARLAERAVTFDNFYAGSMPCMPARREMHTGRYNFLHRSWGPLEPFDDSMPEMLRDTGVHTHLATDHFHYFADGGATYHTRYSTWEFFRGQAVDPWKGVVKGTPAQPRRQDAVNRSYMPTEAEHMQTRTVDAGIEFLETNVGSDNWLLQVELFDPHEPFFSHEDYKKRYPHSYDGPEFDWPTYTKVTEPEEQVAHARCEYAALVSMCDHSLGRVLDFMDGHDMWRDTMLIVNTDHGFLLGERGWWAKNVQPWYNELVRLPFFLWDPRTGEAGTRRSALAQTIDLAPTLLRFFGLEPSADMQGRDLAEERPVREGALFGIHGGHVNVTDGRHVYMRAPVDFSNTPLEEFTLMPTHLRSRFGVGELTSWEPAEPFTFTKGLRTMRITPARMAAPPWTSAWRHGTLLFDLATDPGQESPIADDEVELRMLRLLARLMHDSDAPAGQFERLGIPFDGEPGPEHLLVWAQAERAAAIAEPLPSPAELPAAELLAQPLPVLLQDDRARAVVELHAPGLTQTEQLTFAPNASLVGLARMALISAAALRAVAEDLALHDAGGAGSGLRPPPPHPIPIRQEASS